MIFAGIMLPQKYFELGWYVGGTISQFNHLTNQLSSTED